MLAACNTGDSGNIPQKDSIAYAETDEIFANPERGLLIQTYYTSGNISNRAKATTIADNRKSDSKITLYLHSYYLTDYMESDIPQEFLDRLDHRLLPICRSMRM